VLDGAQFPAVLLVGFVALEEAQHVEGFEFAADGVAWAAMLRWTSRGHRDG